MSGLEGNDLLYGQSGNDILYGNSGDDEMYGGEGDDHLHPEPRGFGSSGVDLMVGGPGNDCYWYYAPTGYIDNSGGSPEDIDWIEMGTLRTPEGCSVYQDGRDLVVSQRPIIGGWLRVLNAFDADGSFNEDNMIDGIRFGYPLDDKYRVFWNQEEIMRRVKAAGGGIPTPDPEQNNQPPTLNGIIGAQSANEDELFTYTIPETLFSDDHDTTLSYEVKLANDEALPTWLHFDEATRTLSGTPTNDDVGTLDLKVIATDSEDASGETTFALTVANVNDAPVASGTITEQSATEGVAFNFTLPANTFTDDDVGDTLTYSAMQADGSPLPTWLQVDPATGAFSGTPDSDTDLSITLTATDTSNESASLTFALNVAPAETKQNEAPIVTNAPDEIARNAGGLLILNLPYEGWFSDPDGDMLTYSVTTPNGEPLPNGLVFLADLGAVLGWTFQSATLRITATDPDGLSVSHDVMLVVDGKYPNRAPVVINPDMEINTARGETVIVNFGREPWFSDPDGDELTYQVTGVNGTDLPFGMYFHAQGKTLYGWPEESGVLTVTATDPDGLSVSRDIELIVDGIAPPPPNHAPETNAVMPNQNAREGEGYSYTLPLSLFADPDQDALTYDVVQADGSPLPDWLEFDPATRTLSGTPGYQAAGTLDLKVIAKDPGGLGAEQSFSLTVENVNAAPVVNGTIADLTASAGEIMIVRVPIQNWFTDPDGDELTYTIGASDNAAMPDLFFIDTARSTFYGWAEKSGTFRITATDPYGLSVSHDIKLIVDGVVPASAQALVQAMAAMDAPTAATGGSAILPQDGQQLGLLAAGGSLS